MLTLLKSGFFHTIEEYFGSFMIWILPAPICLPDHTTKFETETKISITEAVSVIKGHYAFSYSSLPGKPKLHDDTCNFALPKVLRYSSI